MGGVDGIFGADFRLGGFSSMIVYIVDIEDITNNIPYIRSNIPIIENAMLVFLAIFSYPAIVGKGFAVKIIANMIPNI